MFIKSMVDTTMKYFKDTNCIEIKPNTVTCIDDGLITEKELKDCYGDRIVILTAEEVEEIVGEMEENVETPVEEPKEELKEALTSCLSEEELDNILEELKIDHDNMDKIKAELLSLELKYKEEARARKCDIAIPDLRRYLIENMKVEEGEKGEPTEAPTEAPKQEPKEAPKKQDKKVTNKKTNKKSNK